MGDKLQVAVFAILTVCASPAWAQQPPPAAPAPAIAAPAPAPAAAPTEADGVRFRWGLAAAVGLESVSVFSGAMYGLDARFGVQVNHLLAIYVQPHLSFGSLSGEGIGAGVSGATGTFTTAAIGEVTLVDHFFVGAGFGYGVLNNPAGPMFQVRAGGYPLAGRGDNGIRRRGLMIGVDLRTIFIDGATGVLVMGGIGYEAF